MKKWFVALALAAISTGVFAADAWMTDFDAAKQKAKDENKHILIDFSGSDWCGWCIKLDKEVFSQKEFKSYAKDNLILVLADFPRDKSKQTEEVRSQNKKMLKEFFPDTSKAGFPTVFILSPNGKTIAQTGYQAGGAEAYVDHIKKIIEGAKE